MTSTTTALRSGVLSYTLASKPNGVFNNASVCYLSTGSVAAAHWWTSLAALADQGAQVSSCLLQFRTAQTLPAANRTWTVKASPAFRASALTFLNKPVPSTTQATATTTAALAKGTLISVDVTTMVQQMLAGSLVAPGYFQLTLAGDGSTPRAIRGFSAGTDKPQLLVTYDTATPVPAGLIPSGGAVGTRKPVVAWTPWANETGQQIQVAIDAELIQVVYDSTMTVGTAGQFDLSDTSLNTAGWQLPVDGTHVYVRARRNGPLGPSDWSPAVETWFRALPTVSIDNPGVTTGDATPPTTATPAGGLQPIVGWRAIYRPVAAPGEVLDDSGEKPGNQIAYTPAAGPSQVGDFTVVEVRVFDSETRVAVRNSPVYGSATKTFQLVESTLVTPVTDLAVTFPDRTAPWAKLTWSRVNVPDEWVIRLDDVDIARVPGLDLLIPGGGPNRFAVTDYTATPNWRHRWTVVPVSNNARGTPSNTVQAVPTIKGIHFLDVDTLEQVQLLGRDEVDVDFPTTVFTSTPLGRGWTSVRETNPQAGTYPIAGVIADAYGRLAEDTYKTLEAFRLSDEPRRLRLAMTSVNRPVTVHSIVPRVIRAGTSPATKRWKVTATAVSQEPDRAPTGGS